MMDRRAAFILEHYPRLWAQYNETREEALTAVYPQGAFAKAGGGTRAPGSPAEKLAVKLLEAWEHAWEIRAVPWFMETLTPEERRLVIAVWRYGTYWTSWRLIRRHFGKDTDCRQMWADVVGRFAAYLETCRKASVGPA